MRKNFAGTIIGFIALLIMTGTVIAQGNIRAVVTNEAANIRTVPAIGATVIDSVGPGYVFETVTARSGDMQWIRIIYNGQEGWVNLAPLTVLQGDISALPVADPRTIPYGGFDAPRAGSTNHVGPVEVRATDGLRMRAGPSTAYPTIGNINFNQVFTLSGVYGPGTWYQASFEGVLGWVVAGYFEVRRGDINALPVDGVVANAPPLSDETFEDFQAVVGLMLARLDYAQESLNQIRASWTDAALNGRAVCQGYPPRPSDIQIAQPLLAAFYTELEPLRVDFNDAMANIRLAIDLFIDVCNQPGTGNPVGEATVTGALEAVNVAERQIASLRDRLIPLLESRTAGPDECLLTFNNKSEILPQISIGPIYLDELTPRKRVVAYCFNAIEGQVLNIQVLPLPGANVRPFVSVSPLLDPKNFVAVKQTRDVERSILNEVEMPITGQYLVIIADLGARPQGGFALRIADITFAPEIELLYYDSITQSVQLTTDPQALTDAGITPPQPAPEGTPITDFEDTDTVCPSTAFTCNQLFTCGEAQACLQAGNFSLDPDGDGVPCEEILCAGDGSDTIGGGGGTPTGPTTSTGLSCSTVTCTQITTCNDAEVCYLAGNVALDGAADLSGTPGNGVPCENVCGAP